MYNQQLPCRPQSWPLQSWPLQLTYMPPTLGPKQGKDGHPPLAMLEACSGVTRGRHTTLQTTCAVSCLCRQA
jgi:hypothetical protein